MPKFYYFEGFLLVKIRSAAKFLLNRGFLLFWRLLNRGLTVLRAEFARTFSPGTQLAVHGFRSLALESPLWWQKTLFFELLSFEVDTCILWHILGHTCLYVGKNLLKWLWLWKECLQANFVCANIPERGQKLGIIRIWKVLPQILISHEQIFHWFYKKRFFVKTANHLVYFGSH